MRTEGWNFRLTQQQPAALARSFPVFLFEIHYDLLNKNITGIDSEYFDPKRISISYIEGNLCV